MSLLGLALIDTRALASTDQSLHFSLLGFWHRSSAMLYREKAREVPLTSGRRGGSNSRKDGRGPLTNHEEVLIFPAFMCAAQRELQKRFSSQAGPRWVSCNCLARDGDKGIDLAEGGREELSQNLGTRNSRSACSTCRRRNRPNGRRVSRRARGGTGHRRRTPDGRRRNSPCCHNRPDDLRDMAAPSWWWWWSSSWSTDRATPSEPSRSR